MRRLLIPVLCVAVLGLAAANAEASALNLLFPYSVNVLEDNDWESLLVGDADTLLEKGEVLVGMLVVQEVWEADASGSNIPSPPEPTFTAVFAIQVKDVTLDATGNVATYTFGAISKDAWDTLTDRTGQNLGLTDPMYEGTLAQIFSDTSDPYIDETVPDSPADSIATAIEGLMVWETGFKGGDPDEFWTATSIAFDGTTFHNPQDITKISQLTTRVSMNVLDYKVPGIVLLPHNYLWDGVADAINPAGINAWAHIHGYGGLSSVGTGVWDLSTDTDFYIVPTPEPGSLALLGLGLAAVGGIVVRRRRRS